MAETLRIKLADFIKEPEVVLARVQTGVEIVIENDSRVIAALRPAHGRRPELPLRSLSDVHSYWEFTKPSIAYRTNVDSPVYHLSELMFGSLLAAYVLGFLGVAISQVGGLHPTPLSPNPHVVFTVMGQAVLQNVLLPLLPVLFISLTYAYVTAGMYVVYQATILTRETLAFTGLRYDFLLSLLHAVSFGCSIVYPFGFPVFLFLTCVIAIWRQSYEHKHLLDSFYRIFFPSEWEKSIHDSRRRHQEFVAKFEQYLLDPDYHLLRGWRATGATFYFTTFALLVIPMITVKAVLLVPSASDAAWSIATLIMCFIICIVAIMHAHRVLGHRAGLLYKREMDVMDEQYHRFLVKLFTECQAQSS